MVKIKGAKGKKQTFAQNGLPCLILLVVGMLLLMLLFYISMRAS